MWETSEVFWANALIDPFHDFVLHKHPYQSPFMKLIYNNPSIQDMTSMYSLFFFFYFFFFFYWIKQLIYNNTQLVLPT